MFYKHSSKGKIVILIVYMHDIILTDSNEVELEKLKKNLIGIFEIEDLGKLKYFLGMRFARSKVFLYVNENTSLIYLVR